MPTRTHSPGSPDPTDEQLAADYRARGDQAVLGQLYARYLELLYGLCLQYLRDAGRAEDATMDIYEQLVTKLRKHEVDHFRPWVYRLARNHCLMLLRKTSSSLALASKSIGERHLAALDDVQLADISHPGTDVHQRETELNALEACRERLSADQALCIRRFYLEGASYKELADSLGWTLNKVRSAIQNGRRNLKLCVERSLRNANA